MLHGLFLDRTLGHLPGVRVSNSTEVSISALVADRLCGEGTRLIYYMSPGQILVGTFTSKDTHTLKGELVVPYTRVRKTISGNFQQRLVFQLFFPTLFARCHEELVHISWNSDCLQQCQTCVSSTPSQQVAWLLSLISRFMRISLFLSEICRLPGFAWH